MDTEKSLPGESAPPLAVRIQGSGWSLPAGPTYLIGRDPGCDIVVADDRVSWRHTVLRLEEGRWVLADNGSTNGIYAADRRVERVEINGQCVVRLSHPYSGPALSCTDASVTTLRIGRAPDNDIVVPHPSVSGHHAELHRMAGDHRLVDLGSSNGTFVNERRITAATLAEGDVVGLGSATFRLADHELRVVSEPAAPAAETMAAAAARPASGAPAVALPAPAPPEGDGPLEIPYAIRWLVPKGERFANFDILNDVDTQLDYYRRFGHIYAVGVPTKK
jgi:pSer/pThr/pTyr-binding forkhead associated (FHA) protein